MNTDAVSQAIVALFEKERFYAEIVAQMRRIASTKVPTAGVCIKDGIELHINVEWFSKRTLEERVAVLKHECEHLLRDHILRGKELAPNVYGKAKDEVDGLYNQMKHRLLNIAADMAINGGLSGLPEGAVYAKDFDLPSNESFEWYMEALKDNEKAKEFMEFDDHSLWDDSEGGEEIVKEKIRKAINDAAAKARAVGKMTGEEELLVSKLNPPKISWKSQLRRFVARSMEVKVTTSKKKRNRRYGILQPGHVKEEVLHIGVAMDTSGSVSDEAIQQFMAEIHNIAKFAIVTVVEADSSIKNAYPYDPKKKYSVKGRGGTAYKPVFDYYNELGGIDGLIYFGDMDCFDTEELVEPKYPVLWAIVGRQDPPASFGSQIRIEGA